MNSESKWETTSSEYGLLEGEYINLIATMCVTDSNSKPFSYKPILIPDDVQEDIQEVQEEAQGDIADDEDLIMPDKGKNFKIFAHSTIRVHSEILKILNRNIS